MTPEKADLLINARWLIPVIPEDTSFSACSVVVRDGLIAAICPPAEARRRFHCTQTLDLDNHVLLPGLVNAHGHAAMSLLRGYAEDLDLHSWLNDRIWPTESRWVSEDFVRDGSELALAEMVRTGPTCFADMYFFPDQVAAASRDAGMRCQVAFPIINFPTAWARDGDDYIHKGLELHDTYRDHPLVKIAFGPHAPYTVANRLFEKIAVYANELDAGIQIHLHESWGEVKEALEDTGEKPLRRLERLGLLSANTQCVHMVAADSEDIELLAASKAHVIHCPKSNMKLGNGVSPVREMLARGINVALGTDGAASNNGLDLFAELQFAALLAKGSSGDPTALDTHQCLRMATINGARALGMEHLIGSVEVGKAADLIAVDLSTLGQQPLYNPAPQLVYTNVGHRVSHSWVAGRSLLHQGRLTTLNEQELMAKAATWQHRISGS